MELQGIDGWSRSSMSFLGGGGGGVERLYGITYYALCGRVAKFLFSTSPFGNDMLHGVISYFLQLQ